MGTNYYHIFGSHRHHIGKSSAGWTFTFHGERSTNPATNPLGGPVTSYADWMRRFEAGGEIQDEYGRAETLDEFKKMVESKAGCYHNQTLYVRLTHPGYADDVWLDPDGHSFSEGEFQ